MKHSFVFEKIPQGVPARALPDGPVTGNGDLSLMWSGAPDRLRLYFTKVDFWKALPGDLSRSGLSPIGYIEIGLPHLADSPYFAEQNMDEAFIEGRFSAAHTEARIRSTVCATENIILLEMELTRPGSSADAFLAPVTGGDSVTVSAREGDLSVITRAFEEGDLWFSTAACAAMREISRHREGRTERIRYAVSVITNHDDPAYEDNATQKVFSLDDAAFDRLLTAHTRWWNRFWSKSSVTLPDAEVENNWYAGLYIMACCARNLHFPPGLWGNFSTQDAMPWHSDYHMNYNFQAPFYGVPSANHIELMDCLDFTVEKIVPWARTYAKKFLGCRGVYFPVGMGPMGLDTSRIEGTKEHGILFLGQKSNAAFMATNHVMRWKAERDLSYAEAHGYPFLREVAEFWEDYLVLEDGRYMDYNDFIHEVGYWESQDYHPTGHDDVNPVISLGLIAMVFECVLDMSRALGLDEEKRARWQDILERLAKPVIYTREDGKEYIRASEQGMEHTGIIMQYMYPAMQLGSRSDPRLYAAMRNVMEITDEWVSENRFCTFYPAAVRLGVEPERIFAGFHRMFDERGLGNGLFRCEGGGIENNAAVVSTVNDMLLQSFEGVIRLFPDWDRTRDVSFTTLRADGAFLVSASLTNGEIEAEITSEKGGTLRVESPADAGYELLYGDTAIPFTGEDLVLDTVPGDVFRIRKSN